MTHAEEPFELSGNLGFITNSSSVIFHFPLSLLQHPDVVAVLTAFGVTGGVVGDNLWSRDHCASLLVTPEQKAKALDELLGNEYSKPEGTEALLNQEGVVLVYGDEYDSLPRLLCTMMRDLAETLGVPLMESVGFN